MIITIKTKIVVRLENILFGGSSVPSWERQRLGSSCGRRYTVMVGMERLDPVHGLNLLRRSWLSLPRSIQTFRMLSLMSMKQRSMPIYLPTESDVD